MNITEKVMHPILLLLCVFGISACSTYPNKFKCGDARGLGCTMLREVDMQIDSGKIEEAYKDKKKCYSNICKQDNKRESLTLKMQEENRMVDDDNNLYF